MSQPDTFAIVLTFDDPDALARCLRSIDGQQPRPSSILVVDNAGRRAAADVVDRLDLTTPTRVLRLAENTGPAGGHHAGLREFLMSGAELAWVMDDDCEPQPGALALLLDRAAATGDRCDPVYPTWFNTTRGEVTNYPAWCGFLIRRATCRAVGLPRPELFWWMEDTEYLHWRIPEAGYEAVRVDDAVVHHHQRRRAGPKAAWKYYYETRNSVYFRLYVQRGRGRRFYRLARAIGGLSSRLLREPGRLEKAWLMVRGAADGLLARLGRRPGLPPTPGPV